jgi:hypothetical protein
MRLATHLIAFLACAFVAPAMAAKSSQHDVVIYGGTAAAITAAVQVKQMGKSVIIVSPDKHLGGLSSGGLGFTDTGNKAVIGGLARQFYHRVYQHYQTPEAWVQQKRDEYGNKGQGTPAMDGNERTMWIFEPHAAENIFDAWVKELNIEVVRNAWLDRAKGVQTKDGRMVSITTLDGQTFAGKMFLDTTYEGDLMAAAGVDYHVGREANSVYGEENNGIQVGVLHHRHHFGVLPQGISPYKTPGDPESGIVARVSKKSPGIKGDGDKRVQAYCFRMCLTNDPANRIPFAKPEGYDANQYELLARIYAAGWRETFDKFDPIPNHKTDTNNHGPYSFDNIGYNYDYPEASYERRREIIREHETYQKGLLYFIANDERVPEDVRKEMTNWGLPKDEFKDNGNWSHQLYIREARRMIGKYVMTENELRKKKPTPESVGMGSYTIDSHNTQRYITPEGFVQNEGDIGVSTGGPYEISYGSLVPKEGQAANLLVPVAMSATHIAYGSIRMEPVFMILGQTAATAAVFAIEDDVPVQQVAYPKLRERLLKDGQILEYTGPASEKSVQLEGIVIDDLKAEFVGDWPQSSSGKKFVGESYRHDGKTGKGEKIATFRATLPKSGRYEVRFAYTPNGNRDKAVPVTIRHSGGEASATIDERKPGANDGITITLGTFDFDAAKPAEVIVSTKGTTGYVVVDAVQWIAK